MLFGDVNIVATLGLTAKGKYQKEMETTNQAKIIILVWEKVCVLYISES